VEELCTAGTSGSSEPYLCSLFSGHNDVLDCGSTACPVLISINSGNLTYGGLNSAGDAAAITTRSSGPANGTIDMPIDHFNSQDARTFKNHYWMSDTFYERGAPVFFYDAGEAGVPYSAATQMLNSGLVVFTPMELAKRYHGIAIVWEHRFYGQSIPFESGSTTGLAIDGYDAYKYLNNEQALQDAVYFATHFQPPGH
jgi:hypothetical protein